MCFFHLNMFPTLTLTEPNPRILKQLLLEIGWPFPPSNCLNLRRSARAAILLLLLLLLRPPPVRPHPSFATKLLCFITCVMLFGGVEVGNCCSHRNANAEGSCQALIRVKGIHRSDPRFSVPADEPHATSLPTAG